MTSFTDIYQSETDITDLFEGFCARTLPKEQWTHAAHLTTGLCFLKQYEKYDATCRMKSGIVSYNLSVGGENTGGGGYHETLTIFWMEVLHFFTTRFPDDSLHALCNRFLSSALAGKTLPFDFYDKETLMSPFHRSRYVAPDKRGLTAEVLEQYC